MARLKLTSLFLALIPHLGACNAQPIDCASGAHIIVARGSTEDPGTGSIGVLANRVANRVPASDVVAVDYPATFEQYYKSETAGVKEMRRLVVKYATACPAGRIVLMGYSQGAQVSADVVCSNSEPGFPHSDPLPTNIADNISAVLLLGDPSHVASALFNRGTSTKDGRFPRRNIAGCAAVQSKMASYCDTGDKYCDQGNDEEVHRSYIRVYGAEAVSFVVDKVNSGI